MVERIRCAGNAPKVRTVLPPVLPPVLPRDFAERENVSYVIVYTVVDDAFSPGFPLGVELEVFIRREDAERFMEEVRGDDPELARSLQSRSVGLMRAVSTRPSRACGI